MAEKRLITKRQEQIFRLVHHDFGGLSQTEAAQRLGISQSAVSNVLKQIKKKLPQYFPILTKIEAERYHLYVEGWSVENIAEHFGVTPGSIYEALQRARDKGMYFTKAKGRILSYDSSMDADVKQKF